MRAGVRLRWGVLAGLARSRTGVLRADDGLASESGVVRLRLPGVSGATSEGGEESVLALVLALVLIRGVAGGGIGAFGGGEGPLDMVARLTNDQSISADFVATDLSSGLAGDWKSEFTSMC